MLASELVRLQFDKFFMQRRLNEWQKLGAGKGGTNVDFWVTSAKAGRDLVNTG